MSEEQNDAPPPAQAETEAPAVRPAPIPAAGPQIDPTGDMKPVPPEQLLAEVGEAKRNRWLAIFIQLARSERFLKFVERNYIIQDRIDEDKKQISTVVYENPKAVGPGLTRPQVAKIFAQLKMYGTRKPEKVLNEILLTLGQEEAQPSIITSANEADVEEAAKQSDLKKGLD